MQLAKGYKRIVIKIGSSIIGKEADTLNQTALGCLVDDISKLQDQGMEMVLVSSGAVFCGMLATAQRIRPAKISQLQSTAAIGQNILMHLYSSLFKKRNKLCAQVLLTWDDFDKRSRYLNAKNTLLDLIRKNVIPVVNENDTVSVDEIRFGDNDKLSALVAGLIDADLLIMLSDVDGLFRNKDKDLIPVVENITSQIKNIACGTDKASCVGGMSAKVEAAAIATSVGIPCVIANGHKKGILAAVINKESVGTIFLPKLKSGSAREKWLTQGVKPKGRIFVDDGAKQALVSGHKSLLAVGVINVEGSFNSGDAVMITDGEGLTFAKGLVNFSSQDLRIHKGKRVKNEVIHRNNLIIL